MDPAITTIAPDITVVAPSGRLTVGNIAQRFEWSVSELIEKGSKKIILDMALLSYMDSAGLGIVISCTGKAKAAGGQLRLANVPERINEIFKLTGTDKVLTIEKDVNAAAVAMS
jgi:anti-sigma B factor antagonist